MSLAREHYVYAHRRASDGKVFYVGKGKDRRAWASYGRNRLWKFIAGKHGFVPLIVKDGLPEHCALSLERIVIAVNKGEGLANFTDGGGGITGWQHSEETRRLIGQHSKTRPVTPKMLAALDSRGRKATPAQIEKMRAAKLGKKHGPMPAERRAKIAASHIGIRPSAETLRKMSLAKIGKAVGRDSPSYDHTERHWRNVDGREFAGTRGDFIRQFGLRDGCVSVVINGKQKSVKGWSLV